MDHQGLNGKILINPTIFCEDRNWGCGEVEGAVKSLKIWKIWITERTQAGIPRNSNTDQQKHTKRNAGGEDRPNPRPWVDWALALQCTEASLSVKYAWEAGVQIFHLPAKVIDILERDITLSLLSEYTAELTHFVHLSCTPHCLPPDLTIVRYVSEQRWAWVS